MKSLVPFIVRFLASFFAVVTNYIVAKHLGVSSYGIYAGMLSLTFFINLVTDWGFNSYGSQMLAQINNRTNRLHFIQQSLQIKLFLSFLFTFVYVVIVYFFFKSSFYYLLGIPIIFFSFLNPEWIARGLLLPEIASYRQLLFSILCLASFYLLYVFNSSEFAVFLFYSISTVASFTVVLLFLKRKVGLQLQFEAFFNKIDITFIQKTSVYFYGYLVNNVIYVSGVLLLSIFATPISTGSYASYYNIFATLIAPVVITYGLFAPKVHNTDKSEFYTSYYTVVISVMLCGVIFYANGSFFYHILYPTSFIFNVELNSLACIVFVLYCLENMFVVASILDAQPKAYFISNLLASIVGSIIFCFLIVTHNLTATNTYIALIVMQSTMIIFSFSRSFKTFKNINFINNIIPISLLLFVILLQYLNVPKVFPLLISALVIGITAKKSFIILNKLY